MLASLEGRPLGCWRCFRCSPRRRFPFTFRPPDASALRRERRRATPHRQQQQQQPDSAAYASTASGSPPARPITSWKRSTSNPTCRRSRPSFLEKDPRRSTSTSGRSSGNRNRWRASSTSRRGGCGRTRSARTVTTTATTVDPAGTRATTRRRESSRPSAPTPRRPSSTTSSSAPISCWTRDAGSATCPRKSSGSIRTSFRLNWKKKTHGRSPASERTAGRRKSRNRYR
mmetsp:Transcript_24101/g.56829  ORF Transcript_24101/g.56829 Transcript_24101/m.56829 type:complete len:229 (+) Transcript_24101:92-778(+)